MADETFVIVDAQGNEHEFPAGMDPKAAAKIVRAHTTGEPIAANEPDTYLGGAFKGLKEGLAGGAQGFFEGIGPGVLNTIPSLYNGIKDAAVAGVGGLVGLYQNGLGKTASDAGAGLKASIQKVPELIDSLSKLAATDPEAFGKAVGELTGNAEGMSLLSLGVTMAPRPLALKIGEQLHRVGKTGEFAAYLTGAHQIASGKPEGLVTMAVPAVMRAASKPLIRFGSKGTPGSMVTPLAEDIKGVSKPAPEPVRTPYDVPAVESAAEAAKRMQQTSFNERPLHEQMDSLPVGADAPAPPLPNPMRGPEPPVRVPPPLPKAKPAISPQERAMLKKQGFSDEVIAKLEAQASGQAAPAAAPPPEMPTSGRMEDALMAAEPPFPPAPAPRAATPTAAPELTPGQQAFRNGQEIGKTRWEAANGPMKSPQEMLADAMRQAEPPPGQGPNGLPAAAGELAQQGSQDYMHSQFEKNKPVVDELNASYDNPLTVGMSSAERGRYVGMRMRPKPQSFEEQLMAQPDPLEGADISGEAVPPGEALLPGPAIGDELPKGRPLPEEAPKASPFEDQLAAAQPEENLGEGPINLEGPNVVPDEPLAATPIDAPPAETPKPRKIPLADANIASKSRRSKNMMSSTPGLTIADMKAIGMNPRVKLTHLTQEMIDAIRSARANRTVTYRTNAGLDKGFSQAMESD